MIPAIKIESLSKSYELRQEREAKIGARLKNIVLDIVGNREVEMHHVLNGISLTIQKGEILGVIGRNGCGKSTLLQLMSNIVPPSSGTITIDGRVTSILGIGAGFHPDLTGRENVYMNGSLLGMRKTKIDEIFDEIHVFSGIGDFIDEPVKNYSNGMYLRLAFSVFSHLETDILLLDEILAVGDSAFHEKAKTKISELSRKGKTIVIVSHNPGEIIEFCTRCVLINDGKIEAEGEPQKIFSDYLIQINHQNKTADWRSLVETDSNGRTVFESGKWITPEDNFFRLISVRVKALGKKHDEPMFISDVIEIEYIIEKKENEGYLQLGSKIVDVFGTWITTDSPNFREDEKFLPQPAGIYTYTSIYDSYFFNEGLYTHTLVLGRDSIQVHIPFQQYPFEVHKDEWIKKVVWGGLPSPLLKRLSWRVERNDNNIQ